MLTDAKLRAFKCRATAYRVADANGLCIEVRPTGAKVWRYRYRYAGKASMVTLDEYPTMSLAQARAERARLRSLLQDGANPSQLVRAERAVQMKCMNATFYVLAAELLKKCAKEGLKSVSIKRARRTPEKDAEVIADAPRDMSTGPSVSDAVTTVNMERHPLPDIGYLRLHQIIGRPARNGRPAIAAIIPVSRSTWWEGVKSGRYPQPVRALGARITAWRVEDVIKLII